MLVKDPQPGVSENRLNPIFPMVLLIIIPIINPTFSGPNPHSSHSSGFAVLDMLDYDDRHAV